MLYARSKLARVFLQDNEVSGRPITLKYKEKKTNFMNEGCFQILPDFSQMIQIIYSVCIPMRNEVLIP